MIAPVQSIFYSVLFEIFGPNLSYSSQEIKVNVEGRLWFFDVF